MSIFDPNSKELNLITAELKEGYESFYHFSLSLLENLDDKSGNLKFAVVNMQIALELFLKCYFLRKDMPERVGSVKNGKFQFKGFSEVVNSYFSVVRNDLYISKKGLNSILETRNGIVHRGKFQGWDSSLADYIIRSSLFMQAILRNVFQETLLESNYETHNLSNNFYWRNSSMDFAKDLCSNFDQKVFECPYCFSRALVSKELFEFNVDTSVDNYQCISCLMELDIENAGELITCCACDEKSYFVDTLNPQDKQGYVGRCLYCDNQMELKKCHSCEEFFFQDILESRYEKDGLFYCSSKCKEAKNLANKHYHP